MLLHQLSGFEFSNLTLMIGVLVSTAMLRITGINPGGILAAAFLILAAVSSIWWALTLPVISIIIALLYKRFFSHIFLGRQPLFIMAAMSVAIMTVIGTVMQHYRLIPPSDYNYPLGIILPAILASAINKQGIRQTYTYLGIAIAVTAAIVSVVYGIGLALGHDFHALDRLIATRELLHIGWGGALSLLSIAIGYTLYRLSNVKSAGYIMLPFLATLIVVSPRNFLLIIGMAVVGYTITAIMRRYSLILGVGRYSFALTLAVAMVWTAEYLLLHHTADFSPFMGTSLFAALAISVLVNEHTIYGIKKATPMLALSLFLMVGIEVAGAYTVQSLTHKNASVHSLSVYRRQATIKHVLGGK